VVCAEVLEHLEPEEYRDAVEELKRVAGSHIVALYRKSDERE